MLSPVLLELLRDWYRISRAAGLAVPQPESHQPDDDAPVDTRLPHGRANGCDHETGDAPLSETLWRVPDYAELLVDSGGSMGVEPALLGIILTRPQASPLPLGGLHEQLGGMLALRAAHTPDPLLHYLAVFERLLPQPLRMTAHQCRRAAGRPNIRAGVDHRRHIGGGQGFARLKAYKHLPATELAAYQSKCVSKRVEDNVDVA